MDGRLLALIHAACSRHWRVGASPKSKCKHQKKNKQKNFFKIFCLFFSLLESVVSWLQITQSVLKKGLEKVFKAFFVWLVSFRQKLHKSAELLKRRGPVTGIFYFMIFSLTKLIVRRNYYKDLVLLVLLPRNSYMKTKFSAYWEISGTKYATFIPKFIILLPHKVYIISTQ